MKKFEIICERKLIEYDLDNKEIKVLLGKPSKYQDTEFICAFQIIGLENSQIQYAHGEDSFQALIMALEGIRVTLNKSDKNLTWIGGEKGDHGFPRFVTMSFGLAFSQLLDNIIDQEIKIFAENAQKK
ncbi:MAG: hypothetical protein AB1467_07195 [Candidatus Diapherotrites archaeon]